MQNQAPITSNIDNRFEALFNSASMAIIVVDGKGQISMANSFANNLFGHVENSLIGEPLEKLIPQRHHTKHVGYRNSYIEKPNARSMGLGMTLSALRSDGTEFPVEISLGHFTNGDEKFAIAFIADITKRKLNEEKIIAQQDEMEKVNEEMKKLNANLEITVTKRTNELQNTLTALEASKNELTLSLEKEKEVNDLKSRFVSMASHEFRTPLSTILSSISLLSKYTTTEDQSKRDKHIDRIKSSVKTLTDILNEFLSLGRIEEGKVDMKQEVFDLVDFMQSINNEMSVLLKPGQIFKFNHLGNNNTYTDSNLLKHIMINLLSNAIKFSPDNAIILIDTEVTTTTTNITITDKGIGIPATDQIHLFERFFRATNVTNIQGTGLGLHIVGRYVELLNGTINYHSEFENGSTFIINLPSLQKKDFE
jgi:PAS domain S-box-containing protein